MNHLILVEGIPGSGKTTMAEKITAYYRNRDMAVDLYPEGPGQPVDLSWHACFPIAQYQELLKNYNAFHDEIKEVAFFDGEYTLIPFTQIQADDENLAKQWELFDLYDGLMRPSAEVLLNLLCHRWQDFSERVMQTDRRIIFESAFLQANVNRLLLWDDADTYQIINHHNQLIRTAECLSPVLIYLSQPDIEETVRRVADERVSPESKWIDGVIAYCEKSPFGERRGLRGWKGVNRLLDHPQRNGIGNCQSADHTAQDH